MAGEQIQKSLKIIVGLLLLIVGLYGIIRWWGYFLDLIKGSIGIFVILIGLLVIFLGISD